MANKPSARFPSRRGVCLTALVAPRNMGESSLRETGAGETVASKVLRFASGPAQQANYFTVVADKSPRQSGIAVPAAQVYIRTRREERLDHLGLCLRILTGKD